jgi:dihydroxyacid dehydratase/phosphogluconate dehydratase
MDKKKHSKLRSDMVRISDARMSGTAILHVSPEAAAGGTPGSGAQR